eukprot:TRINITY_DN6871_c1_g5_i1.p2 TRINITY_DN6871_c1_g5~~TRINITY_DN6871_c1_g5_i1.p2  ORF type:complete len:734 (-),score=93.38 TRINITY_DN6871_c1_g5_i1:8580-10781(-)
MAVRRLRDDSRRWGFCRTGSIQPGYCRTRDATGLDSGSGALPPGEPEGLTSKDCELMQRFFSLLSLIIVLIPGALRAQTEPELAVPAQSDVRIIVDISGSMKETDPDNLRQPAVRLLARMLPEGTTAGVWTFGQYVNMLVPHREVTEAWREKAIAESAKINSVALRTNLGKAIEVASDDYFTQGELNHTHFILLTDGNVDISDDASVNSAEEARILDDVIPQLISRGATFHPVALSEQADAEFLRKLADASGGRFQVAASADALSRAFLEALNAAVPQEQIPIEGDGFTVDDGVQEFTALVFWGAEETGETRKMTLVRPDGQSLMLDSGAENVSWARESGYDLVTIENPQAGRWRIEGELGEGSRVTVVSDLRMVVSPLPPSFSAQTPVELNVAFFEDQQKITSPDFLGVLNVSLTITAEDGRSGTKVLSTETPPEDGVYSDTISKLPSAGLYKIDVVADGKTFARKFSTTTGFTVPEGAEATPVSGVQDAVPANVEETPEPEEAAVEPTAEEPVAEQPSVPEAEPVPEIPAPIDVSQAEPVEVESPDNSVDESESGFELPFPVWVPIVVAGGLVVIVIGWFAMKQRKSRAETQEKAAAERETVEDLEEELPTLEPETPEEMPEPDVPEEEIPEIGVEDIVDDTAELEAIIDGLEEEIPELESEVTEPPVEEPEQVPEETGDVLEDDDEEFGLEDFDLSEFDDLPGYEEDDDAQSTKKADPKDPKNNEQERDR